MSIKDQRTEVQIVETIIGVFMVDTDLQVVSKTLFSLDPEEISEKLENQKQGIITDEVEKAIKTAIETGFNIIKTSNIPLAASIRKKYSVKVETVETSIEGRYVRNNLYEFAQNLLSLNQEKVDALNHDVSQIKARKSVQETMSNKENMLIQSVQLIGDIDTMLNNLSNRLRELYSIHFPELDRILKDHMQYGRIVKDIGRRVNIGEKELKELGLKEHDIRKILQALKISMGASINFVDLNNIQNLADEVIQMFSYRENLREYISSLSKEITPNTAKLAGPILAGKLIERAGGLKKLAMLPSSTIQVLGAEKAIYRAIKTGAKPPKHGVIFQHPYVHGARRGERGKKARNLAGKLAIAARADFFSGNPVADKLKKELEEEK